MVPRMAIQVTEASRGAAGLLSTFEPLANRAAPLASRFVIEISEQEVAAAAAWSTSCPGSRSTWNPT
jgi:hypothetical protein